jgi:hypothetical protein
MAGGEALRRRVRAPPPWRASAEDGAFRQTGRAFLRAENEASVRIPLLSLIVLGALSSSGTGPLRDESSGVQFAPEPTVNGVKYECLGAGLRKVFVFDAYALTFCVDQKHVDSTVDGYVAGAHPNLSGEPLAKALQADGGFYRQLAQEPGNRLVVMRTLRDLTRGQLADAFKESLSKVLPPASVAKLVAAIPSDAPKGSEVKLSSKGDVLTIDIAGSVRTVDDAEVARHVWDVWLSKDSVSPSLKTSIADRTAARLSHATAPE